MVVTFVFAALLRQQPDQPAQFLANFFAEMASTPRTTVKAVTLPAGTDTEVESATKIQAISRGKSSRKMIQENSKLFQSSFWLPPVKTIVNYSDAGG